MMLEEICKKTIEAVKQTGKYISAQLDDSRSRVIETKGKHNYVTEVDKTSEELLVHSLSKILPEAGFITEEGTAQQTGETYNWIIDPIDGTTNFIHGAYPFAISVALAKQNTPILGVILEIGLNECFYAWEGGGAYLNGKRIHVSNTSTLSESLIATGFPYTNFEFMENFIKTLDWFMKNSHGLRRLGSAATDIAWVACGRYDGFYEYALNPWDIAAGIIILQEAGGKCSDFSGGDNYLDGKEIICSNTQNHQEFENIINELMKK